MIIIGITGTLGAGKGTVVEYLKQKYGFKHYSASDFLKEEIARRGIVENRDNMRIVADDLRATHKPSFVIENLYNKAVAEKNEFPRAVIESIRSIGEAEFLKSQTELFFFLAVDADPRIRYERILGRKSTKDHVSFEEFLEDEQLEMANADPSKMNLIGCIKLTNAIVENNTDLNDLHASIDKIIQPLLGM